MSQAASPPDAAGDSFTRSLGDSPADPPRPARRGLAVLLLASLLVRGVWGQIQPVDDGPLNILGDQRDYLAAARNFLAVGELAFVDARFNQVVYAFRPPGYPLFLIACGARLRVVRLAQAGLDTSTVLAVYLLARRWLPRGRALFAAAVVALNPFLIYFSGLILTETLFAALLAWGMVLLSVRRSPRSPGSLPRFLGGLVLASSVLVRPSAAGLLLLLGIAAPFLPAWEEGGGGAGEKKTQTPPGPPAYVSGARRPRSLRAWRAWRVWALWDRLPPATGMLCLLLAVSFPWAWRNHLVLGRWVWTTTNAGITAYDGFNDQARGDSDQSFVSRFPFLARQNVTEVDRDEFFQAQARTWVRAHPREAATLALVKLARTWSPLPLSADFGRPLYQAAGAAYAIPFDVLVLLGAWKGRLPRSVKAFVLLPALYFTAVHAASVGSLRYRIPSEPPMTLLAASVLRPAAAKINPGYRRASSDQNY